MARRKSTRRGRGEGTVFERANGTWAGEITTGYDEKGKQKRKTVYGKTQADALAKVAELRQRLANGSYSETKLTLTIYIEQWLEYKERFIKPSTHESYEYAAHCFSPTLVGHALTSLRPYKFRLPSTKLLTQGVQPPLTKAAGYSLALISKQ